jgi:hypothetical protein
MLTQYMFAFVFPDTRLATAVYADGNVPDGVTTKDFAEQVWEKLKSAQPRLLHVPYKEVGVYIRSADGLYIQVHGQGSQ